MHTQTDRQPQKHNAYGTIYRGKGILTINRHRFDGRFSRTTCVSRYKGKPIWMLMMLDRKRWWGIKKGSPHSIAERRVPELIPALGSQPAGDVSHKPDGRLPLLSARPAVTPATLERVATNFDGQYWIASSKHWDTCKKTTSVDTHVVILVPADCSGENIGGWSLVFLAWIQRHQCTNLYQI